MPIIIKEVISQRDLKKFVYLPRELHRDHPGWVPPFYSDDLWVLTPGKNPAHDYSQHLYLLAYEDGKLAGRAAGIINERYNDYTNTKTARFGYMDTTASFEVAKALLDRIELWAKDRGMDRLIGPMGFTEEDPEGFIIFGFDEVTNLTTYQNHPYTIEHLARLGYDKEIDYFVYKVDIAAAMTPLYRKIYERVSRNPEFRVLNFRRKSELGQYIKPIFKLMNESFDDIYGYSPLDEKDVEQLAKRYMPLLDPRFIKAVVNQADEVVGFIIGIPNIAEGLIKAKGRIFPFGFIHLLRAQKRSTKLDTYLGAVKKSERSKGIDVLLGYNMMDTALKAGFKILDSHHEMELNTKIRAEMERAGGVIYKKYRIFKKDFVPQAAL